MTRSYLRPTNGRADDQVRHNHSAQCISHPDWTWFRFRKETPDKHESYVDLVPGEWTKVKIEVRGAQARLYVHGRPQSTLIAAPVGLAALAGGSAYTIAATADGEVWTWGAGGSGQLGEGTTINRSTPAAISDPAFAWRVATSEYSITSGTYDTDRNVVVTDETPGATIHYTVDGNEPTTSDPTVASGGTIVVDRSLTLKAKAFKSGMPVSLTASAVYTMKVGTPATTPGGGIYTSAQSVTITTVTPGTTLHYTTDGSEPTAASTVYSGPVPIASQTTLKAIGVKADWTTSNVRTSTYTLNYGTLAAPTASVSGGSYIGPQTVTLTAFAGATIRYTTSGSEPSGSSTIYAGPLSIPVNS